MEQAEMLVPGCRGDNAPLGYTANLSASSTHLELLAAGGLTKENKISLKSAGPLRDANKCRAHLGLRVTQNEFQHLRCLQQEAGWLIHIQLNYSLNQKAMAMHRLHGSAQAKQIK